MLQKQARSDSPSTTVFDELTIDNRKHISQEIFEKLREAILSGDLPAGYVLPNENELCQKLNIGRGSLREAYAPLETLHLITRTKAGTYVNSQREIQNSMNLEAIAQRATPQSLSEYRHIAEVGIVQLASQKAVPADIEQLEKILDEMRTCPNDAAKLSQLDFDFHSTLVRITKNELLLITFNTIRSIYESFTESVFASGYFEESLLDHQNIIDAVKSGDPQAAGEMMTRHLDHVHAYRGTMPEQAQQ